jgi:hypothetical protein
MVSISTMTEPGNSRIRRVFSGMAHVFAVATILLVAGSETPGATGQPPVSLRETFTPSPLVEARNGNVIIAGHVDAQSSSNVLIRVTTSHGITSQTGVVTMSERFHCRYPADFPDAPPLTPCVLFIDAAADTDFCAARQNHVQAEATLVVRGGAGALPDLPSAFTCDLLDRRGARDADCTKWPATRALVNLFMHSQGARTVRVGDPNFDLANPKDLEWFKNNLTLYEFDYRDRDWSQPLGHRLRRTFWQSVWNTWFNSSNDNPLDGDPANSRPFNYRPYAFANDFADILIMYVNHQGCAQPLDDNLDVICREGAENLMAMQHRGPDNFALGDTTGRRENYTAGAFHYGMFKDGAFLTEGKGWFYNPAFRDYADGGVLNGRAVWGLGETLRFEPRGPLALQLKESVARALKFCLHDGAAGGYVKTTPQGRTFWRDPGEHAYLVLGMLAACEVAPEMPVRLGNETSPSTLRRLCIQSLDALADLERPDHSWSIYPNVDSMAIAALAEGASQFRDEVGASRWRRTACRVADAWLAAKVDSRERSTPTPLFGLRVGVGHMTHIWSNGGKAQYFYYQDGHWIQALADLYALTGDARYRTRAEAILSYLCGDNPWQMRLFNELGAVYNWTDDTDGDGIEDLVRQDMYPESTAYCQIGIMHLLRSLETVGAQGPGHPAQPHRR